MTQGRTQDTLSRGLARIVQNETIGQRQKEMARALLTRFDTPISVTVMGPDADLRSLVFRALSGLSAEPAIRLTARDNLTAPNRDAFSRIDIAIWCSFAFGTDEQAAWAHAPDVLKDRSALVLLCDDPTEAGKGDEWDLFDEVVAVSLKHPASALSELDNKLLHRVQAGLRADADNAAFLIESCKLPEDEGVQPELPSAPKPPKDESSVLLAQLETMMAEHAATLRALELDDEPLAAHTLSSCADLVEKMTDLIERAPSDLLSVPILEEIQETHDGIILMALEGNVTAAAEAITTLIQLRKELHLELAA